MKCPKYKFENREGAKFCDECSHNLALSSEPAPKELSFDEKTDKIQRYLPKGLTKKLNSAHRNIKMLQHQVEQLLKRL